MCGGTYKNRLAFLVLRVALKASFNRVKSARSEASRRSAREGGGGGEERKKKACIAFAVIPCHVAT